MSSPQISQSSGHVKRPDLSTGLPGAGLTLIDCYDTDDGTLAAEKQPLQPVRGDQRCSCPDREASSNPPSSAVGPHPPLNPPSPAANPATGAATERQLSFVNRGLWPRPHGRLQTWHSQ